jgi:hypothetical protein
MHEYIPIAASNVKTHANTTSIFVPELAAKYNGNGLAELVVIFDREFEAVELAL